MGTPCLYSKPRKTTSKLKSQWFTVLSRGSTRVWSFFGLWGSAFASFMFFSRIGPHLIVFWWFYGLNMPEKRTRREHAWTPRKTHDNIGMPLNIPRNHLERPRGLVREAGEANPFSEVPRDRELLMFSGHLLVDFFSGYTSQYMGGFSYIKN